MSALALALVLSAAVAHATWNMLAKRSGGSVAFVWLFSVVATVAFAVPAAIAVAVERPHLGGAQILFMVGSGVLHIAYFLLLQTGYRAGDLSLVYPSARGTGVLLATFGGILIFGEHPTAVAIAGAVTVALGVFAVGGLPGRAHLVRARVALSYALATGVLIATYTLWDKHAVDALDVPPLFYFWGFNLVLMLGLAPLALRARPTIREQWRASRREAIGVGVLSPASYVLVLSALAFTPVSYVAPARELSIVFGSAMGTFLLKEGNARARLLASATIAAGVVMLAVG
jgi:drug/metabolite transporter (DMT)-like permease